MEINVWMSSFADVHSLPGQAWHQDTLWWGSHQGPELLLRSTAADPHPCLSLATFTSFPICLLAVSHVPSCPVCLGKGILWGTMVVHLVATAAAFCSQRSGVQMEHTPQRWWLEGLWCTGRLRHAGGNGKGGIMMAWWWADGIPGHCLPSSPPSQNCSCPWRYVSSYCRQEDTAEDLNENNSEPNTTYRGVAVGRQGSRRGGQYCWVAKRMSWHSAGPQL